MFSQLTKLPRFVKTLILVLIDALIGGGAFWLSTLVRSGFIPSMSPQYVFLATALAMVLVPVTGFTCGLYRPVIRFQIPLHSLRAGMVGGICGVVIAVTGWAGGAPYPRAIGLGTVFALVVFALLVWSRHAARWLLGSVRSSTAIPVAIYGAGAAGRQLSTMFRRANEYHPMLFIDDDSSLRGRLVEDLVVVSPRDTKLADRLRARGVKEILLAIPSLRPTRRREILDFLSALPFRVRSVPGLTELIERKEIGLGDLRDISIEDLLGRDSVAPMPGLLDRCVKGKVVLVTGGGGSIGSELCRQVIALQPLHLVVLEHSEYALYQIEQELRTVQMPLASRVRIDFVLGSVTDAAKLAELFSVFRVDTVYHAAAYKHVPIVEHNPLEGLRNNVLGTWYVARAAAQGAVKHFILISSDKAVRPTNVMGATKRMSELVIQTLSGSYPNTVFSMVRFGNVLGSSGSVVPLFRDQIERGGPITLTHADVTRYFMTIEEAVQLVIQAGAMASGGEVFVLDMGEPVRIMDLAAKMIYLSGRSLRDSANPQGDIAVEVVGLRPGEKLYEELLIGGEVTGTLHPRIWQVREDGVDNSLFESALCNLEEAIRVSPRDLDVRGVLTKWVAGYARQGAGVAAAPFKDERRLTLH
jgi:FlaA1/EpsC-like NDP-sugar epimerase